MKKARLTRAGIFTPRTRARATDPDTSAAAAATVDVTLIQRRVLSLFNLPGWLDAAFTHVVIIAKYRDIYGETVSESTIRTRVAELVDLGLMEGQGTIEHAGSGRDFIVWGLTTKGRAQCQALQT